jgi:hypothetical protein
VQDQKRHLRALIGRIVREAGGSDVADQVAILFNGATVSAAILDDARAAARARQAARTLLENAGL